MYACICIYMYIYVYIHVTCICIYIYIYLSPYIKDLIAHVIGIENVVQNALSKDRTYDN